MLSVPWIGPQQRNRIIQTTTHVTGSPRLRPTIIKAAIDFGATKTDLTEQSCAVATAARVLLTSLRGSSDNCFPDGYGGTERPSPQCQEASCQGERSLNSSEEKVRSVFGVDPPESETRLASATDVFHSATWREHRWIRKCFEARAPSRSAPPLAIKKVEHEPANTTYLRKFS